MVRVFGHCTRAQLARQVTWLAPLLLTLQAGCPLTEDANPPIPPKPDRVAEAKQILDQSGRSTFTQAMARRLHELIMTYSEVRTWITGSFDGFTREQKIDVLLQIRFALKKHVFPEFQGIVRGALAGESLFILGVKCSDYFDIPDRQQLIRDRLLVTKSEYEVHAGLRVYLPNYGAEGIEERLEEWLHGPGGPSWQTAARTSIAIYGDGEWRKKALDALNDELDRNLAVSAAAAVQRFLERMLEHGVCGDARLLRHAQRISNRAVNQELKDAAEAYVIECTDTRTETSQTTQTVEPIR